MYGEFASGPLTTYTEKTAGLVCITGFAGSILTNPSPVAKAKLVVIASIRTAASNIPIFLTILDMTPFPEKRVFVSGYKC